MKSKKEENLIFNKNGINNYDLVDYNLIVTDDNNNDSEESYDNENLTQIDIDLLDYKISGLLEDYY